MSQQKKPNYQRIVLFLSDKELQQEFADGKGDPGYQEAVRTELEKRVLRKVEANRK